MTRDNVWIREAALPEAANTARSDPMWMIQNMFDGDIPTAFPTPLYTVAENQEQAIRDLEIPPELFTPPDQIREWAREWPSDATPASVFGATGPMQ